MRRLSTGQKHASPTTPKYHTRRDRHRQQHANSLRWRIYGMGNGFTPICCSTAVPRAVRFRCDRSPIPKGPALFLVRRQNPFQILGRVFLRLRAIGLPLDREARGPCGVNHGAGASATRYQPYEEARHNQGVRYGRAGNRSRQRQMRVARRTSPAQASANPRTQGISRDARRSTENQEVSLRLIRITPNGHNCRKSTVVSRLATSRATPHPRQRGIPRH